MNTFEAAVTLARLAGAADALQFLCRGKTDKEIGRRALLLLFVLEPGAIGTQRELARRMGVGESRACQMLKVIRRHFRQFSAPG